jgi:hypothetical protein
MNYTEDFEQLWKIYPKRAGSNPKPKAFKAFNARLKEKVLYSDLQAGLLRYYNFCKQTGILRTSYVMQAATFFSANSEAWLETWELPKQEEKKEPQKDWPPGFDPTRQCGGGESVEACRTRAWRNHERPH